MMILMMKMTYSTSLSKEIFFKFLFTSELYEQPKITNQDMQCQ